MNKYGEFDDVVPFIGEQSFMENVTQVLQMEQVTAHLMALPSIDTTGHTIESLTLAVQQAMTAGFEQLKTKVLVNQ